MKGEVNSPGGRYLKFSPKTLEILQRGTPKVGETGGVNHANWAKRENLPPTWEKKRVNSSTPGKKSETGRVLRLGDQTTWATKNRLMETINAHTGEQWLDREKPPRRVGRIGEPNSKKMGESHLT